MREDEASWWCRLSLDLRADSSLASLGFTPTGTALPTKVEQTPGRARTELSLKRRQVESDRLAEIYFR